MFKPFYNYIQLYSLSRANSRDGKPPRIQPSAALFSIKLAGLLMVDLSEGNKGVCEYWL